MNTLSEKMLEMISHMKVKPDFTRDQFSYLEDEYLDSMCKDKIFSDDLMRKWNTVVDEPCPTAQDMLNNGMRRTYKNKRKPE